jgi:Tfp pilus assembly protein FimT
MHPPANSDLEAARGPQDKPAMKLLFLLMLMTIIVVISALAAPTYSQKTESAE